MATKAKADADEKTLELIKLVQQKKAEIKNAERSAFVTNCSFSFDFDGGNTVNLHVAKTEVMLHIASFLVGQERNYDEAGKKLGLESVPKFMWGGFSSEDWMKDIKTRIDKIQISEKKKKLEVLEGRLNAVISPELRQQMELEAIQAELA